MVDIGHPFTEADLARLPCRARVAFAARCARLIHPRFKAEWPDAPDDMSQALAMTIGAAERMADGHSCGDAVHMAGIALKIAQHARKESWLASAVAYTAHCAAYIAYHAAYGSTVRLSPSTAK